MSEKHEKPIETQKSKDKIKREITILKALKANSIDMLIIIVISIAILLIGDFVLRTFCGFFVADLIGMLLFLIIIVTVVYNTIMQSSIKKSTFGERASKILLANGENKSEKR